MTPKQQLNPLDFAHQENGIYILAKLILPQNSGPKVSSLQVWRFVYAIYELRWYTLCRNMSPMRCQCYAFRALRFLFSVERNRHRFKRLFPTDLYESFIDVGHYMRDLEAYEGLQIKVSQYSVRNLTQTRPIIEEFSCLIEWYFWGAVLQEEELESLRESIMAVDHNRPVLRLINGYAVLDHLGTGAFGSVLKVQAGQHAVSVQSCLSSWQKMSTDSW